VEAEAARWLARMDAGLTLEETREFSAWRKLPAHAAALSSYEHTLSTFDRPLAAGQGAALARQFRERFAKRRRRKIVAASSVLTCVALGLFLWRSPSRPPPPATVASASAVVILPQKRVLPDGSVVELKSGADIAVDFSGTFRRVALKKGEAHFQVAKDAARPFVVEVAGVEVKAVGTAFSVELGSKAVAVLVTEGTVSIDAEHSPTATATPVQPRAFGLVHAGNRLVVALAEDGRVPLAPSPVTAPEVAERLAWRAPRLEFTDAPLAEAVALVNQYNRVQLVIEDPALASQRVSGFFRADNYEALLTLLEQGAGIRSERSGERILLKRSP
jgi:transmembrane sensor